MSISKTAIANTLDSNMITSSGQNSWSEEELLGSKFKDARLNKRFQALMKQLSNHMGESIPLVCQDWANTKAAYRFLSNNNVSEKEILEGHFQTTSTRFAATEGFVLVLKIQQNFLISEKNLNLLAQ